MRHVFVMDPLESVKGYKDTTYFLMLAARMRGHTVYYLPPGAIHLDHDRVTGEVTLVDVHETEDHPFTLIETLMVDLSEMDVVWIRTDPPVDRGYLYTTLLLDFLPPSVRVVNRPATIRDWNEKLAALRYPAITPPTLVSSDVGVLEEFVGRFDRATLKPIDGHGGKGIRFVAPNDSDLQAVLAEVTSLGQKRVLAQAYLPEAKDGDKRILLLEGEPLGAILRLHAEGVELNNLDQGGQALPSELNQRDIEICQALRDDLCAHGVFFAGIDVIGGMLMEVNLTSPTGLQEMSRFDDQPYHLTIVDRLEASS